MEGSGMYLVSLWEEENAKNGSEVKFKNSKRLINVQNQGMVWNPRRK